MFRDKPPQQKTTVNVLLGDGGAGDHLCSLIAVDYIKRNYSWINPLIWVPDYLLDFAKHVLPKDAVIRNYTQAKDKFNESLPGLTTQWKSQHTPMRTHPVDYAFHQLADVHFYTNEKKNYLKSKPIDISSFDLPENYIVITPTSVERVKRFSKETIDLLSQYVISLGYTPVYLGKDHVKTGRGLDINAETPDFDRSKGIDLINKTNLIEAASIISGAKLFIGMDGGLVHLAGFTDTKIVAGYTFASPEHLMPIRNNKVGYNVFPVVPEESLGCRFCQTNWGLLYNHDFRKCRYDDYKCTKDMTFEKFKKQIDEALNG